MEYVKRINGYAGGPPLIDDNKIVLDAGDIHITGSSGDSIRTKVQSLANSMRILELEPGKIKGYYIVRIGSFRMTT